jgi:hypothetical protein
VSLDDDDDDDSMFDMSETILKPLAPTYSSNPPPSNSLSGPISQLSAHALTLVLGRSLATLPAVALGSSTRPPAHLAAQSSSWGSGHTFGPPPSSSLTRPSSHLLAKNAVTPANRPAPRPASPAGITDINQLLAPGVIVQLQSFATLPANQHARMAPFQRHLLDALLAATGSNVLAGSIPSSMSIPTSSAEAPPKPKAKPKPKASCAPEFEQDDDGDLSASESNPPVRPEQEQAGDEGAAIEALPVAKQARKPQAAGKAASKASVTSGGANTAVAVGANAGTGKSGAKPKAARGNAKAVLVSNCYSQSIVAQLTRACIGQRGARFGSKSGSFGHADQGEGERSTGKQSCLSPGSSLIRTPHIGQRGTPSDNGFQLLSVHSE